MVDIYQNRSSGLESPGYNAAPVAPNDTTDLPMTSRALFVGSSGDLNITMAGGGTVLLRNVPIGFVPMRVSRVLATGTTAADIVAVW